MAYAIVVNARPGDIARFERRGVKVVNLPGTKEKYGEVLAEAFRELREYLRNNLVSASKVTEEEPLRELLLPRDATTRLCFFSLPLDVLPFYRDRVFPVTEEAGFVPVTASDFITPGDSVSAKIDTLIDRAAVMIVELNSRSTRAELAMAIARTKGGEVNRANRRPLKLILIATQRDQIPPWAEEFQIVTRPSLFTETSEDFVQELKLILERMSAETGFERRTEPQRLLEAKEYRAAVIAAMTLLEATIRQRLSKEAWTNVRRPMSLRSLIDRGISEEILRGTSRETIDAWIRTPQ